LHVKPQQLSCRIIKWLFSGSISKVKIWIRKYLQTTQSWWEEDAWCQRNAIVTEEQSSVIDEAIGKCRELVFVARVFMDRQMFGILKFLPAANLLNNLLHLKCVAALPCNFSLTTIHVSDYRQFSDISNMQCSAATFIRRCGILIDDLMYVVSTWFNFRPIYQILLQQVLYHIMLLSCCNFH